MNLENFELQTLSHEESQEVDGGGFLGYVLGAIASTIT